MLLRTVLTAILLYGCLPGEAGATRYAGEFLAIGVGPRAMAMGGAFVGAADDATAGYWNPAGLAGISRQMLTVMHSEQLTGLAYDCFAYVRPLTRGDRPTALGVSLIRLGVDNIPITRLPDPSQPIDALLGNGQRNRPFIERYVSDAEYAALISIARRFSPRFAIGGNIKLVRKSTGVATAFGAGLDMGVMIRPISSLTFGTHIMNITTTALTWSTGRREYITPTLKTGVAYERTAPRLGGRILIAADVDMIFEGRKNTASVSLGSASASGHIGMEYRIRDVVSLRSGYEASGLTAGAGIHPPAVSFLGRELYPALDYAFINDSAFGAVHRIGASLAF